MKRIVLRKASSFAWASVLLGVTVAAVYLAVPGPAAENTGHYGLVGTWTFKATATDPNNLPPGFPPAFEGVETFYSDGTMNVVTNLPGPTIGAGVWKQTGPQRYTFTFTFYRPDVSSPLLLPARVHENVLIYDGGAKYKTTDMIMPLDANGQPYTCPGGVPCVFTGTVEAERYQFATFNNVLPQP